MSHFARPVKLIPGEPAFFTMMLNLRIPPCTNPASWRLFTFSRTSIANKALLDEINQIVILIVDEIHDNIMHWEGAQSRWKSQ
jgi:hypothetical protein